MTTHYPDNDTVDVASSLQRERVPASSAHSGNRAASQPDNDHIRGNDYSSLLSSEVLTGGAVRSDRSSSGHKNKTTQSHFAKHFVFALYRGALAFSA